jgi:hypothetical protein
LEKGRVKEEILYQVGLPFMAHEAGIVAGNHCLSIACTGRYCWHKTVKLHSLKEGPVLGGHEGEELYLNL